MGQTDEQMDGWTTWKQNVLWTWYQWYNCTECGSVVYLLNVKLCVCVCPEQVWPWSWWMKLLASWQLGTATPTLSLPLWTPSTSIARSKKVRMMLKTHSQPKQHLSPMLLFFYFSLTINKTAFLTAQLDVTMERNSVATSGRTSGKTCHCYDWTIFHYQALSLSGFLVKREIS